MTPKAYKILNDEQNIASGILCVKTELITYKNKHRKFAARCTYKR